MAMVRLTVKGLHDLQNALQASGEINAAILPKEALSTMRLAVAWARGADGQEHYLVVWRDKQSWTRARSNLLVDVLVDERERSEEYADHTERKEEGWQL